MANATTTVPGDIQLAGDLAGSTNGLAPQLSTVSGLTPGAYTFPNLTVDGKGRVTTVTEATSAQFNALFPALPTIPALPTLTPIPAVPVATTTTLGTVQVGSGLAVDGAGVISAPQVLATTSSKGLVQIGTGLAVISGVISAAPTVATTAATGVVKVGAGLLVDGTGLVTLAAATASTLGGVATADTHIVVSAGQLSLTNVLKTDATNTLTKPLVTTNVTANVAAAPITVDLTNAGSASITWGSTTPNYNCAITLTGLVTGGTYMINLNQSSASGANGQMSLSNSGRTIYYTNGQTGAMTVGPYATTAIKLYVATATTIIAVMYKYA